MSSVASAQATILSVPLDDDGVLRNLEELQLYHAENSSGRADDQSDDAAKLRSLRVRRQLAEADKLLAAIQPLEGAASNVLTCAKTVAAQAADADDRLRGTESRLSRLLERAAASHSRLQAAARKRHWSALLAAAFVVGEAERAAGAAGPGRSSQDEDLAALVAALEPPSAADRGESSPAEPPARGGVAAAPTAPSGASAGFHASSAPAAAPSSSAPPAALSLPCDCFSALEHVRWARQRSVALLGTPLHDLGLDALRATADASELVLQGVGRWAVGAAGRLWSRSDPPEVAVAGGYGGERGPGLGLGLVLEGGGGEGPIGAAWTGPQSGGGAGGGVGGARERLPADLDAIVQRAGVHSSALAGGGAAGAEEGDGGGALRAALEALGGWEEADGGEESSAGVTREEWLGRSVLRARLGMASRARARAGAGAGAGSWMRLSLRWLALRPALLRRAVQAVVGARRRAITRDLVHALSRGRPERGVPPLDARLHDSAGYVSDVLGWVHGRLVEEREGVLRPLGLLPEAGGAGGEEGEAGNRAGEAAGGTERSVPPPGRVAPASLDDVAAAVAQPVRVRLQQAVEAAGDGLAAYRILDSLALYRGLLSRREAGGEAGGALLSPSCVLLQQLSALEGAAQEALFAAVKEGAGAAGARRTADALPSVPADLGPNAASEDAVERLAPFLRLLGDGGSGGGGSEDGKAAEPDARAARLAPVLSAVLRPALEAVRAAAGSQPRGPGAVHTANSLEVLLQKLQRHGATAAWVQRIAAQQSDAEDVVVEEEAQAVLGRCGFREAEGALRGLLEEGSGDGLAAAEGACSEVCASLWAECQRFELSKGMGGRLRGPRAKQRVRRRAAQVLRAAFEKLRGMVGEASEAVRRAAAAAGDAAAGGGQALVRPAFASVMMPSDADVKAVLELD